MPACRKFRDIDGDSSLGWASICAHANDSLAFLNRYRLPGIYVRQFVGLAARPLDFNRVGFSARAKAERGDQLTLRKIAGAAANHLRLLNLAGNKPDHGADSVAIGLRSHQLDPQAAIRCSFAAI